MATHELKINPSYFEAVKSGEKNFEVRLNDRGFQKGDELILKEYDTTKFALGFTGHDIKRRITYVHSGLGMKECYVVLGLEEVDDRPQAATMDDIAQKLRSLMSTEPPND